MIDRTQEDINQDARIAKLETDLRDTRNKLATVEAHADAIDATLGGLLPLRNILEHVQAVKAFFEKVKGLKGL